MTAVVTGCAERARIGDPARSWRVRIADGLTTVGDEELLRRAVDNLVMNVLVHTPGDTVGTISASATAGRLTIEVSDDGPGVPPDKLPHIFERFYRAGAPSRRPGSGLGLAIAAEIVSAHGGTAQAAPAGTHGLRITLTIPVRVGQLESEKALALGVGGCDDRTARPHGTDSLATYIPGYRLSADRRRRDAAGHNGLRSRNGDRGTGRS
jgi:K+-sensing histidine kinase KdpD